MSGPISGLNPRWVELKREYGILNDEAMCLSWDVIHIHGFDHYRGMPPVVEVATYRRIRARLDFLKAETERLSDLMSCIGRYKECERCQSTESPTEVYHTDSALERLCKPCVEAAHAAFTKEIDKEFREEGLIEGCDYNLNRDGFKPVD